MLLHADFCHRSERKSVCRWLWLAGVVLWLVVGVSANASAAEGVSAESIKHAITSLKANGQVDDAIRKQALELYQQALSALDAANDRRENIEQLKKQAQQAPGKLARLQRKLNASSQALTRQGVADLNAEQLSARRKKLESKVTELQSQLAEINNELANLTRRPTTAREELASARKALRKMEAMPAALGEQQKNVIDEASETQTAARRKALNAKVDLLKQELATLDARQQVLEARQTLTRKRLERYSASLAVVRTAFAEQQISQASQVYSRTQTRVKKLADAPKVVAQAAQKNLEFAAKLQKVTRQIEAITATRVRLRDRLEDLENRFNLVQRQLQIGGVSVALANVLREQKSLLRDRRLATRKLLQKLPDLNAMELQAFQLQQQHMQLENAQKVAATLLTGTPGHVDKQAQKKLVEVLKHRQAIVARLASAKNRYVDVGRDLRAMSQQYEQTATAFANLVDERLFWLPSFAPIDWAWFIKLAKAVPVFFDPGHWAGVVSALFHGALNKPWVTLIGVLFFVALLASRWVLRGQLRHAAEPIGNVSYDTFWVTLRAAGASALLCVPWALPPALAGWLMLHAHGTTLWVSAVGTTLVELAQLVLFIMAFRQVCCAYGLAQSHFQWPDSGRRRLRRGLRYLLFALMVPTFFVGVTQVVDNDLLRQTIGRLAFMFGSVALAWFAWHVLHPHRGILSEVFGPEHRGRWLLGYCWIPLAVGIALTLAALAGLGYFYTGLQLESRYFLSAGLLGASFITYNLIIRWVTVAERRLALARARRKREEARETRATREAAAVAGEGTPDTLDSVEIDMVQVNEQTRSLIRTIVTLLAGVGLWFIWSDLLPALNQLNSISLWQYVVTAGDESYINKVTLGALLLALGVGMVTALAGRNLPGFLEITILRRFSLEAGSRYAIAKLFQYAIVVVGLLVAVSLVGVSWSSIQWLVAALGVGLGFGLQEIFANFISGLVILFERPVRVGDTVSVGTLTGTVSRIRIRATTITDWDNKEVIIPNKTFITETVINWTLTDAVTRLIVRVSIARDADTELAEQLINEAIEAEPSALEEPAPSVFIVGIEEGQIVYEARVFFYDLYYLLPLQHALYRRIKDAFAEHDIDISFPQKDLHIRSVDESVGAVLGRVGGRDGVPSPE